MSRKEADPNKKKTGGNVASIGRWIGMIVCTVVVGLIFVQILSAIVGNIPAFADGAFLAPEKELVDGLIAFDGLFIAFAVSLRLICKTTLRDFMFGAGRKLDIKETLIVGGIFAICFVLGALLDIKYTAYDYPDMKLWFVNFAICLLFLWVQTSTEEVIFRGLFLRIPFGNEIPPIKKGMISAVISSLLFMLGHLSNPEVTSRSGIDAVFMASSYFISGLCMFIPNLYMGGMEAGLIIHFVNNFLCFTLIKQEITVMTTPTLFVDHIPAMSGLGTFVNTVITYVPIVVYVIYKKKKSELKK